MTWETAEQYIHSLTMMTCATIRRVDGGWEVEDSGQQSISGGRWVNRMEACREGREVFPDVFPTLLEAIDAGRKGVG